MPKKHDPFINVQRSCREAYQSLKAQGKDDLRFTATFSAAGRKLNCIEDGDPEKMADLLRSYFRNEKPDKVKVDIVEGDKVIWSKTFAGLVNDGAALGSVDTTQQQLGEAEIFDIVERKFQEKERERERAKLAQDHEEAKGRIKELEAELEEARDTIAAKSKMEHYAGLAKQFAPAISGLLSGQGGTLGQIAGALAGFGATDEPQAEGIGNITTILNNQSDDRRSLIEVLLEFLAGSGNDELNAFLALCQRIEKDRTLLGRVLNATMQYAGEKMGPMMGGQAPQQQPTPAAATAV
jgi:hypothetical protein